MAIRKASMVALRVFGTLLGVEIQVHVGSALVVAFLMSHLAAEPYDTKRSVRHLVLHRMDTVALIICWLTLWSGVFFYRDSLWNAAKVMLTIFVVVVNAVFFAWAVVRLFRELAHEKGASA